MQVKETENKGVEVEETTGQEIKTGNGELTEEGENPKGESWVAIPEAELEGLIQKAAKAAVSEFKRQEEKDKKRDKYHFYALIFCLFYLHCLFLLFPHFPAAQISQAVKIL